MWKFKNFFCVVFFVASSHAATLQCTFSTATPGQLPVCQPTSLIVTQPNEAITVAGAPFANYYDNQTTSLYMSPDTGFIIQEFPRIFSIFTFIQSFSAQNISMTELPTDAFYNCRQLYTISMNYANIGIIRARFASTCVFVQMLNFWSSKITAIEEDAFVGMTTLQYLSIYQSQLTCIPPRLFYPLEGIHSLMLSYNNLTAIHSQAFADLNMLQQIDLSYNQIQYIPNWNLDRTGINGFGGGSSSLYIQLNDNPIRAIHPQFITSLIENRVTGDNDYLQIYFHPSDPAIITTCIDPNWMNNNPMMGFGGDLYSIGMNSYDWVRQNATYFYYTTCYSDFTPAMASDSLVTCGSPFTTTTPRPTTVGSGSGGTGSDIPPGQCATDKICRYYLDWNNQYTCVIDGAEGTVTSITGTHYLTYTDLDLTRLYFINSHLSLIPKIIFQKFPNLKFLHTANSGMTVINDQTFNECGVLELWDASDNDISRVDETSLRNCTNLRIIDLTGNPIDFVSQGLYQLDPALQRIHLTRLDDWTLA